jgi:hypothetical protein
MKTLILALFATVVLSQSYGQDAKPEQKPNLQADTQADLDAQKRRQVEKPAITPPSVPGKTAKPVSYGGFLVDLAKSDQPIKMLDIRTPVNGTNQPANLYTDPQTGKPRGFVLFAIKF